MSPANRGSTDTPSKNLRSRIRNLADAIRAASAKAVPKENDVHIEWGTVQAVNTDPPTVDIIPGNVQDGISLWSQVSCISWYTRIVDGTVSNLSEDIVLKAATITIDASVALLLGTHSITATLSNSFAVTAATTITLTSSDGTGTQIELYAIGGQGAMELAADMMGFFRTSPVAQISASTLSTAADIINALQTYGIFGP